LEKAYDQATSLRSEKPSEDDELRAAKIAGIANDIPLQKVHWAGPAAGWRGGMGSTFGPSARRSSIADEAKDVSHIHIRT